MNVAIVNGGHELREGNVRLAGYKHMAVDYTRGGFTNDVATSGVYLSLGLKL